MEKQLIQTIEKENCDVRIVKCQQLDGYKVTYWNVECKHCDYVQECNRGNIILHLKVMHDLEWKGI